MIMGAASSKVHTAGQRARNPASISMDSCSIIFSSSVFLFFFFKKPPSFLLRLSTNHIRTIHCGGSSTSLSTQRLSMPIECVKYLEKHLDHHSQQFSKRLLSWEESKENRVPKIKEGRIPMWWHTPLTPTEAKAGGSLCAWHQLGLVSEFQDRESLSQQTKQTNQKAKS